MTERLAHVIREAMRAVTKALTVRLARHGVSFGHWQFLRILWDCDGLTQRELSERAGVMEPTTATALKAMEKLGYVRRKQVRGNRKNVYVHLTPKGKALRAKLEPLAVQVNEIAVKGVPVSDIEATRRTLSTLLENFR